MVITHPKVADVISLNNGFFCDLIYWSYVFCILSDPYDHMVMLDDMGIDYETQTPFDVFLIRWQDESNRAAMKEALKFFIGGREFDVGETKSGEIALYDVNDPAFAFGEVIFEWLVEFVKSINCVERTDKIKPADKSAKQILIEDMRDEQKKSKRKKKDDDVDVDVIGDRISALLYGGTGGVTPFNFMQLPIYELMHGADATHRLLRVRGMLNGIYTGMLDGKKLPDSDLRWT